MADAHYVAVAPHCIASPIGTLASVHVTTAVPNFLALEWHGMSVPFWEAIIVGFEDPVIEDGYIEVPKHQVSAWSSMRTQPASTPGKTSPSSGSSD